MSIGKLLIVDSQLIVARELELRLLRRGYEVCGVALSVAEALEKVACLSPELVAMDVDIDGERSGIEAAAHIRRQWGIPVVLFSAFTDLEVLDEALRAEPYGFIPKPVDPAALLAAVELALRRDREQKAQAQREDWLAAALRALACGVIATDAAGTVMRMNAEAERCTGWIESQAHGKDITQVLRLLDPGSQAHAPLSPDLVLSGPEPLAHGERLVASRNGATVRVRVTSAPIMLGGKTMAGVLYTLESAPLASRRTI